VELDLVLEIIRNEPGMSTKQEEMPERRRKGGMSTLVTNSQAKIALIALRVGPRVKLALTKFKNSTVTNCR
jgi:hypothetical protein